MSMSDHDDAQDYTANGPSAFGFRTGGANISVGAELTGNDTGVHGVGEKIGVLGEGQEAGVHGRGTLGPNPGFDGPAGVGVHGESQFNDGVVGTSGGNSKSGVYGFNNGLGFGVYGRCNSVGGVGVQGSNTEGDGVVGISDAEGKSGVYGFNSLNGDAPAGYGVFGRCNSIHGAGIGGSNEAGDGIVGTSNGQNKSGVYGFNSLSGDAQGYGVFGRCNSVKGAGVGGSSQSGRGGTFESNEAAQLQLIPHPPAFELPTVGENGDLIAVSVVQPAAGGDMSLSTELWFCVKGSSAGKNATWGRVQFDKFS
jgi:hypothetical protein